MRTDVAGGLFLGMAFTFLSCVSTKKTTTTNLHTVDSSSSFTNQKTVDTSNRQSITRATDLDVTYYFDTPAQPIDSSVFKKSKQPEQPDAYWDGSHVYFPDHSKLVAIHIHADTVTNETVSGRMYTKTDTSGIVQVKTTQLNQTVVEKKTLIPWWLYVAGGLLLLLIILITVYKIVK